MSFKQAEVLNSKAGEQDSSSGAGRFALVHARWEAQRTLSASQSSAKSPRLAEARP